MKTICCNIRTTLSFFFTHAALIFFVIYSLTSAAYSADDLLTKNTEKKKGSILQQTGLLEAMEIIMPNLQEM